MADWPLADCHEFARLISRFAEDDWIDLTPELTDEELEKEIDLGSVWKLEMPRRANIYNLSTKGVSTE